MIAAARTQTTGQLRAATRRAVIAADPTAARTRKEQAWREARVERWTEPAGTAALAGRDLPPAHVLAADKHLTALVRELHSAGAAGTIDNLRAHVYLALLSGQNPAAILPPGPPADAGLAPSGAGEAPAEGTGPVPTRPARGQGTRTGTARTGAARTGAARTGAARTGARAAAGLTGSVNLTLPVATWLGLSQAPGDAAGFGPLDAADSRALAEGRAHL